MFSSLAQGSSGRCAPQSAVGGLSRTAHPGKPRVTAGTRASQQLCALTQLGSRGEKRTGQWHPGAVCRLYTEQPRAEGRDQGTGKEPSYSANGATSGALRSQQCLRPPSRHSRCAEQALTVCTRSLTGHPKTELGKYSVLSIINTVTASASSRKTVPGPRDHETGGAKFPTLLRAHNSAVHWTPANGVYTGPGATCFGLRPAHRINPLAGFRIKELHELQLGLESRNCMSYISRPSHSRAPSASFSPSAISKVPKIASFLGSSLWLVPPDIISPETLLLILK